MTQKQVTVRIKLQGGETVEAQLVGIGNAGEDSLGRLGRSSGAMGSQLQNASFQVSDFFVQIASGTDVTRAAAQQLPQLLAGFGVMGAVAGAAASILPVLWGVIAGGTDRVGELEAAMKELEASTNAFVAATDASLVPLDQLREKYGSAAAAVRELQIARREAEREESEEANENAAEKLAARFGDLRDALLQPADMAWTASSIFELGELVDELGVTEDAALRLAEAFIALEDADGPYAQVAAAQALVAEIDAATGGYGNMTAAAREVYNEASKIAEEAARHVGATERAAGSMWDFVSATISGQDGLSGMVGQANSLAAAAANAAASIWSAMQAMAQQRIALQNSLEDGGDVYSGRGGDPRTSNQQGYGRFVYDGPPLNAFNVPIVRGGVGGGGGGGGAEAREANDLQREAARLFEETRTEAEKYSEEIAKIDQLLAKGLITQDTYNRGVAALKEEYEALSPVQKAFRDGIDDAASAMADWLVEGKSLREGLRDVFQGIARDLAQSGFRDLLNGLFGGLLGGGGGGGGLFSGLFSGLFGGGNDDGDLFDNIVGVSAQRRGGGLDGVGAVAGIVANGKDAAFSERVVRLEIVENEMFAARVDAKARDVATEVVRDGISQYDRKMAPDSRLRQSRDPRVRY